MLYNKGEKIFISRVTLGFMKAPNFIEDQSQILIVLETVLHRIWPLVYHLVSP